MNSPEVIERLAAEIGERVYLDVAKWHLYLNDAKLHIPLAEKAYALMVDRDLSEKSVTDVLNQMKVPVGGGQREIPLIELLPQSCQRDLMDVLEEFEKDL